MVRKAMWTLAAVVVFATAAVAKEDLDSLRQTLTEAGHRGSQSLSADQQGMGALKALEHDGSAKAVAVLQAFLTDPDAEQQLKQETLEALGRIGTREAVAAIEAFEAWAQARFDNPPPFAFGPTGAAVEHFASYSLEPFLEVTDKDGAKWAMVSWGRYDGDFWLTKQNPDGTWSDPVLLDLPKPTTPGAYGELKRNGILKLRSGDAKDTFVLDLGESDLPIDLAKLRTDGDSDGLTDVEERFLGTDPAKSDSDADGKNDKQDGNPLTPASPATDDLSAIRQAIFLCQFATSKSRSTLLLEGGDAAKQEYRGYAGYIVPSTSSGKGPVRIGLSAKLTSPTKATGGVSDYEGPLAASWHEVKLKKVHGKWVVVDFRMTAIS